MELFISWFNENREWILLILLFVSIYMVCEVMKQIWRDK